MTAKLPAAPIHRYRKKPLRTPIFDKSAAKLNGMQLDESVADLQS